MSQIYERIFLGIHYLVSYLPVICGSHSLSNQLYGYYSWLLTYNWTDWILCTFSGLSCRQYGTLSTLLFAVTADESQ